MSADVFHNAPPKALYELAPQKKHRMISVYTGYSIASETDSEIRYQWFEGSTLIGNM